VIRIVRARKVEDERERQVRVWWMCFVDASQGEMKVLRKVRAVRRGRKKSETRMRVRCWRMGCEEKGVVEGIAFGGD
jgi:hypothetical protein